MRRRGAAIAIAAAVLGIVGVIWGVRVLGRLDAQVEARFTGRLFSVPTTVYAAPVVLYPGLDVRRVGLVDQLERLRYERVEGPDVGQGQFAEGDDSLRIGLRPFRYPHHTDPGGVVELLLDEERRIVTLEDEVGREQPLEEIEPEVIADLHGPTRADRRLLRLEEFPSLLIDAVLAVEDQRFFEHPGVDVRRIIGAFLANLRAARIVQGGSTLTQQLVKNLYLTPERTLRRKLREAVMAVLLERRHTKQELLEVYLNEVYMGQRGSVAIHGMGEAAFHYLAKDAREVDLSESALLAGLIKGPNLYSPYSRPEVTQERRDLVLGILLDQGRISEEDYAGAIAASVEVREPSRDENLAPYFADYLREDLMRVYGEEILQSEGLSVYTTLDVHMQRVAERAVEKGLERLEANFPPLRSEDAPLQAALVALVPRTGEILALVGGRDYPTGPYNRATRARRQPGSVFKPVVALAALSRRDDAPPSHTLASPLLDEPLHVDGPGPSWDPVNYDGDFRGEVTLRDAIEQSPNVPVARLGLDVGPDRIIETARRLGVQGRLDPVPSLALGVFEVTLLEAARAYAVLAAEGLRPHLRSYVEVLDAEGQILEHKPLGLGRVFTPEETYLVTSLLEGAVDRGTARAIRRMGFEGPIAAKTGTTSSYRDAWFIAYLPDLLVGVWVGFDDGRSLGVPGSVAALPIAADFLLTAVGPEGRGPFTRPAGVVETTVELPGRDREFFLSGTEPGPQGPNPLRRLFDWFGKRS
jgi:penicillin-binding protein 1B